MQGPISSETCLRFLIASVKNYSSKRRQICSRMKKHFHVCDEVIKKEHGAIFRCVILFLHFGFKSDKWSPLLKGNGNVALTC
uniref:Uncharacterized protein n=1 Tax=Rhizophora mucronata TaxID=61149 RepID=A0A2P2MLS5_RHIMU